jgi:dTMP kinase
MGGETRSEKRTGRLIALEGGEGAGKSRLQQALGDRLKATGRGVVLTREPGGTALGESIRDLLLAQRAIDDPLAELLLFEAARAHLVADVIAPALERGAMVLCDRFAASSVAYQGYGRGLGRDAVEKANAIATKGITPDLTLLLDLPVEAGLVRRRGDGEANHFDRASIEFHERVRSGYQDLARESPDSWVIIDASAAPETVCDAAYAAIARVI